MKNSEQDINTSCCRAFVLLQNSSDCFSKNYALLCLSFLLLLFLPSTFVTAQPGQPAGPQQQYPYATFSPTIAIIIILVIAVLFFMGFFSIYIRQCGGAGGASIHQTLSLRSRRAAAASRGLDAEVIETFPMFQYSEVRTLKIGKGALECAVCLNEFEDDETLRLIPRCDHVFHPECIDAWLGSHITCPVCRANLVPLPSESTHIHPPEPQLAEPDNTDTQQNGDAVSIVVQEHREGEVNDVECGGQLPARPPQKESVVRNFSFNQNRPPRSRSVRTRLFGKFRSHSTGHSLVHRGENLERFTLRLPEEVRKEMINRTVLKRTGSLATLPRASSSRRGYRTGKFSSSSRGRSYGILERPDRLEVKSDRWVFSTAPPFFSKASSVRSSDVVAYSGEGSTMSRTPKGGPEAVKLSLNCLEPKGSDETSLISSDSARLPV